MISRNLTSSIIRPSKAVLNSAAKPDMATRLLKSNFVGKICDTAADNPVLCQSLFSLGICCAARPATNYLVTPDKKDAGYASAHSVASGVVGLAWTLLFAGVITAGVKAVLNKPQKFLKPEVIKKFYPNVGTEEIIKNGKKTLRIMTNAKGEMLKQDGTKLFRNLEPLKITHGEANGDLKKVLEKIEKTKPTQTKKLEKLNAQKAELELKVEKFNKNKEIFEQVNPHLTVDENGIVRSKDVLQTKDGMYVIKNGKKVGCAVQKPEDKKEVDAILKGKKKADLAPITEEIEVGAKKEENVKTAINQIPDILLAPPRAFLTIAIIPWLLKNVFGMEKKKKGAKPQQENQQQNKINQPTTSNLSTKSTFGMIKAHNVANSKKGGV